jgi:hypothetical protein
MNKQPFFLTVIKWIYLIFLPVAFVLFTGTIISVNAYHYNPMRINEDFGAQFLLGYMAFMALVAWIIFYQNTRQ